MLLQAAGSCHRQQEMMDWMTKPPSVHNTHIIQDKADEDVERYAEEVDDGRSDFLWHVLTPHLHHAWPKHAHHELKGTKGNQLDLTRCRDPCTPSVKLCSCLEVRSMHATSSVQPSGMHEALSDLSMMACPYKLALLMRTGQAPAEPYALKAPFKSISVPGNGMLNCFCR